MREHPHIRAFLRHNARPQTGSANAEEPAFAPRGNPDIRPLRYKLTSCPEIDCLRHLLSPGHIAAAELRATEIGSGADRTLVVQNAITDEQFVRTLAHSLGVRFDSLTQVPRSACRATDLQLIEAVKTGVLWLDCGQHDVLVIAPRDTTSRKLVNFVKVQTALSGRIWLTTAEHLFRFAERHIKPTLAKKAVYELGSIRPEFSAGTGRLRLTALQLAGVLTALAAFALAPTTMATIADVTLALIFLGWTVLRAIGILITACATRLPSRSSRTIQEMELPVYSIIVALYREAAAVEGLIESLMSIDYPKERLDILLVIEPDDRETRDALAQLHLGPSFTVIIAPDEGPRTKPKALNIALPFARGRYVAVFDAEDRPEPNQLRNALHAFRNGDSRLACVQARLTIDNSDETWFTRMFTAEYAGLFDVFLPGLAACRLPLPLGGTSNHFRADILREAGAWDPYNVTEDADLGMRLARFGYHSAVINSTTYEEAPSRFWPWLKQRTRWFKGWMHLCVNVKSVKKQGLNAKLQYVRLYCRNSVATIARHRRCRRYAAGGGMRPQSTSMKSSDYPPASKKRVPSRDRGTGARIRIGTASEGMMISVIKGLMAGDERIVELIALTQEFWMDFFADRRDTDEKTLADALSDAQARYEMLLDMKRAFAKETMPYTCIGYLYDEQNGFADNRLLAARVVTAFTMSSCSLEVKFGSKRAAQLFGLTDSI